MKGSAPGGRFQLVGKAVYGLGLLLVATQLVATLLMQWHARETIGEETLRRTGYLSHLLAEHLTRSVESIEVVLDVFGADLAHRDWHAWTAQQGIDALNQYRTAHPLPQLGEFMLFDAEGRSLFLPDHPATPPNISDRPYFLAHQHGVPNVVFGPYAGRRTGVPTFALSRRIDDAEGRFDGVLLASFQPRYLETFCASQRFDQAVEAALVNEAGIVVAACSKLLSDGRAVGQPARAVLAGGRIDRELPSRTEGAWLAGDQVIATSPLEGHAGYSVVVTTPMRAALADWRRDAVIDLSIGGLALATLVLGALLMRSQLASLRRLSAGLEQRVREHTEALRRQLALQESILDAIPSPIFAKDADGVYTAGNRAFLDYLGLPREKIVGKTVYDVAPAPLAAIYDKADRDVMALDGPQIYQAPVRYADRSVHQVVFNKAALRDEAGRVAGIAGTMIDITERVDMEQALRETRDAAEQASRAKSEFLAVMSHEMRTPLNGIIGMVSSLADETADPHLRQSLDVVLGSADTLLTIISDILDFARLDRGEFDIHRQSFDLHDLLHSLLAEYAAAAQARGSSLRLDLAPGVDRWIVGDKVRLHQVLGNLVGNGVKFTEQGKVEVAVSVAQRSATAVTLRFDVWDTGIGITADALERIFQPFTQADPSISRRFGGTGLGLAISRRLIELQGGHIEVESRPDQGSRFWFSLTYEMPAADAPVVTAAPAVAPSTRPLSILLAEDNEVNRIVMSKILGNLGHRVTMAEDGEKAVACVGAEPYDLVLMDMQMPVMDGLAATQAIRALGGAAGRVPIIGVTANAFREDEQRCLAAGMDAYISKPVTPAILAQVIGRLLSVGGELSSTGQEPSAGS